MCDLCMLAWSSVTIYSCSMHTPSFYEGYKQLNVAIGNGLKSDRMKYVREQVIK